MRFFAFARLLATFVAIAFFAVPVAAAIDTSLWGLVSPNIPDDAKAVLYLDGASLKSSALMLRRKPLVSSSNLDACAGREPWMHGRLGIQRLVDVLNGHDTDGRMDLAGNLLFLDEAANDCSEEYPAHFARTGVEGCGQTSLLD
jgi:hypothetical protein